MKTTSVAIFKSEWQSWVLFEAEQSFCEACSFQDRQKDQSVMRLREMEV